MKYERNTTLQALIREMPQIAEDEGLVKSIYIDSVGCPTFGVGTLITPGMPEYGKAVGTPISESRCLQAFFTELTEKTMGDGEAVFGRDSWNGFPMEAKQVFLNMIYNLGRPRFGGFKRMIAAAKQHDWKEAAAEALDSRWRRQVKGRADRLAQRLSAIS